MPQPKGYEPFTLYFYLEYSWVSRLYNASGGLVGHARYGKSKLFDDPFDAIAARDSAGPGKLGISFDATDVTTNLSAVMWFNRRDYVAPFVNALGSKPILLATVA